MAPNCTAETKTITKKSIRNETKHKMSANSAVLKLYKECNMCTILLKNVYSIKNIGITQNT